MRFKIVSAQILLIVLLGCGGSLGGQNLKSNFQDRAIAREADDGGQQQAGNDAIQNLIHDLQRRADTDTEVSRPETAPETFDIPTGVTPNFSDVKVPNARNTWLLSDGQCKGILDKAGVKTHAPRFATPYVKTPLLLDSPIEGVIIEAKWPDKNKRRVMDCRLIVSLIQLARRAREAGVVKIEYYSTWRPVTPTNNCKKGRKGRACRKVAERAQKGQLPSQHSRATAIDIRWFTFSDGTLVDVEADYEKHFHNPPCEDRPRTTAGQFLQQFACVLHRDRTFNVMLTPNADRDHNNHFHFDITPNVNWYILR